MRIQRMILLVWLVMLCASCSLATRSRTPQSVMGVAAHGEILTVPSGTVEDWNIIVSPQQMGVEETGSEQDNRLLAFRVSASVRDPTTWEITALYRFGYAMDNQNIHWVEGSANYLMVRR